MKNLVTNNNTQSLNEQTITSIEIAKATGKRHSDVLKAIRQMQPAWGKVRKCKFSLMFIIRELPNGATRKSPIYKLTKTESLYITGKFDDEVRAKLVNRWEFLEKSKFDNEIQRIVSAFVLPCSDNLPKWQKRFPDIYYKEIFRLNGWDWTTENAKNKPQIIGKWTNTLIYEQLPKGVLEELKRITPKSETGNNLIKYHQGLTPGIGHPVLKGQLEKVIHFMQVSDTMEQVFEKLERVKLRESGQLELNYNRKGIQA